MNRIMIAAIKSGSGKTRCVCALLQALKNRGQTVRAYKCGPDYIDPMFHRSVMGISSTNLDTFFTDGDMIRKIMIADSKIAVMEGVMGLYDGLGGIYEEGSSYHLAKVTKTPIVLVIDAKGMGKSVVAMVAGFLQYDTEHLIKGIILNRMSEHYFKLLKPIIESELSIAVLGYVPDDKNEVKSRHLGLVLPEEIPNMQKHLQQLADTFEQSVDVEGILNIAREAEALQEVGSGTSFDELFSHMKANHASENLQESIVLAVARDEAFCFYYEENIRLLEACGVTISYFSPLRDSKLPSNCDGILLGGGYPELYAKELSQNTELMTQIKNAYIAGMPMVAECGGFMYLHDLMQAQDGNIYKLCGVIPGECRNTGKLVRFGYICMNERQSNFLPEGETIKGHEFHYYDSTSNGGDCIATKPVGKRSYECAHNCENHWFGFAHLYYLSNPNFVQNFVQKMSNYKNLTRKENNDTI